MQFKLTKYNRNISDDDLIKDLQRIARMLKKESVYRTEYQIYGKYSVSSIRTHFGGWNNAIRLAGLRITRHNSINKHELLNNLKRVWIKLGRQPKRKDLDSDISEFSWCTYRDSFGGFRKALEELVKYVNMRKSFKKARPAVKRKRNKTKRDVNYRLRYKVLTRDDYTCVTCGRSPATEKGVRLHIDHIKPYSKGGETVMKNLQTLCMECNIGKGNS